MQNIHLAAYQSQLAGQGVKVKRAASHWRALAWRMALWGGYLLLIALAGGYHHMMWDAWQQRLRPVVIKETPLPYQQSTLHYIYKDRVLPEEDIPADKEPLPYRDSSDSDEIGEGADDDELLEDPGPAPVSLKEQLEKALQEQQQEERQQKAISAVDPFAPAE